MTKTKTRILFVSRAYGRDKGGMERLSFELIEAAQQDTDLSVTKIVHTGSRKESFFFAFSCIPNVLRQAKQADIIHLGDPVLSLAGWLVKTIYKKPVFVMVHGLDIELPNPFYQLYLLLFFRKFTTYVAISSYVKRLLKKHGLQKNIEVISPGFTDQYYKPSTDRSALSKVVKTDVSKNIVLYTVGRLTKRKGQAWFIQHVLPVLPPHVMYAVAGSGPEQQTISKLVKKLGLHSRVLLLGRVSDKDLITLYNQADAFIQPNIPLKGNAEGFGLVLVEAASCAKKVFAAKLEGIPDAIQDGKNGTLLPAGNKHAWQLALQYWASTSQAKNHQLIPSVRTYTLEKFSWSQIYPQYKELLRKVIK